ncbi:PREDICTED: cation/H(+) antiporter 11-like [Tarenaya hassleriana]|uniref:cation/H(+) antiporter 11-like n=1 Tax=Tarenaya hassleriana TaxID=28532 RepID=UPI00053C3D1E|nr:PREDICTED: cation/H(+) antiporter 11-like [Tarenaya hassleriana]
MMRDGAGGGGGCRPAGFNISSYGFLEKMESPVVILEYSLPLLEFQIILIFLFAFFSHTFLRSINIPKFVSHIIAGLILGPQLLGLMEFSSDRLSRYPALDGNAALDCVGEFGFIMFTFLMTVKTNWRLAFRNGKTPIVIAFSSSFFTLIVGMSFKNLFSNRIDHLYLPIESGLRERRAVVSFQSLTLLPVVAHLLSELNILGSQLGRLAISTALISDFSGILLLIAVTTLGTYKNVSPKAAYLDLAMVASLFLVVIFIVKPLAKRMIDHTPEGKPVRSIYLYAIVIIALGSSAFTSSAKQKNVLGPLLVGLAIPDGPPLGSALEIKFEKLTTKVLLPISIAVSTMKGDMFKFLYELDDVLYNMFLVCLTLIVKWVASFLPCLYYKLPIRESSAIAVIMCSRGLTELYLYENARNRSVISQSTHTFLILYVLLSAGIVPTVVTSLYDPKKKYARYNKKNVMSMRHNSDLRILSCVHKPDNISSMIAFLRLLVSPNKPSPMAVTVLHLVKLVGGAFPDMISHGKNSNRVIHNSYIRTAIEAFHDFESENRESMSISMFTAFSKMNIMHEDINTLALNQNTSMIVVPSGRRWSVDGSFESDDIEIRRLNVTLLEHAPCSIGILVDRGHFSRISNTWNKKRVKTLRVCAIYIGGKDDREALSLAKRIRPNPKVDLTVFRFIFVEEAGFTNWDYILDNEVLKEFKQREVDGSENTVAYVEKTMNNGDEIIETLRSVAEEFDFVITGRDHSVEFPDSSGLNDWVELPELGVVGDVLASKELDSRVSVLVVHQQ